MRLTNRACRFGSLNRIGEAFADLCCARCKKTVGKFMVLAIIEPQPHECIDIACIIGIELLLDEKLIVGWLWWDPL